MASGIFGGDISSNIIHPALRLACVQLDVMHNRGNLSKAAQRQLEAKRNNNVI